MAGVKYPPEWSNDEEMGFYFEHMPTQRSIDPDLWDTKYHFWRKLLQESQTQHGLLFSLQDMQTRFRRDGDISLAIEDVLYEMLADKKLVTKADMDAPAPPAVSLAARAIGATAQATWMVGSYALSMLWGSTDSKPHRTLPPGKYCFLDQLEVVAQRVHQRIIDEGGEVTDRIIPWAQLCDMFPEEHKRNELITCCRFLERRGHAVEAGSVSTANDSSAAMRVNNMIYKFAAQDEQKVQLIADGEFERSVGSIKQSLRLVDTRLSTIQDKMQSKTEEAKKLLRLKKKNLAIYPLQIRKKLSKSEQALFNQRINLEETMMAMANLSLNNQIMQSLELGAKTLQAHTISVDEAERIMDETTEAVQISNEITEVLSAAPAVSEVDEKELEEEYSALLNLDHALTTPTKTMEISPQKLTPVSHMEESPTPAEVEAPNVSQQDEQEEVRTLLFA